MLTLLQFLIQTDFVTSANRQDVVRSSPRNIALLDGIAEAFVKAITQLCKHPTLRYQWMRYLPQDAHYPWDNFWKMLREKIHSRLGATPVLWTRSHNTLRSIQTTRRLKHSMLDQNGNPLFPDSNPEQYLASEYSESDLNKLKNYGLRHMTVKEFLEKVRLDLDEDRYSQVKSWGTSEEWHSCLAKFLTDAFETYSNTIMDFSLVPLLRGRWTSTRKTSVYYSHVKGYPIPTDLGLNIVDPRAEKNSERKSLFSFLGVKNNNARSVRDLIYDKYCLPVPFFPNLATSRNHLTFLYLTAHLDMEDDMQGTDYLRLPILDHKGRYKEPKICTVYVPDDNQYGALELFQSVSSETKSNGVAPGLDVSFIHQVYIESPPTQPEGEDRIWEEWLRDKGYIVDSIPLYEYDSEGQYLSEECLYVADYHPEKFIGFLLENWEGTGSGIIEDQRLTEELLQLEVLCEDGNKYPLGKTYLPLIEYQYAKAFLEDDEFFPWLRVEASMEDNQKFSELRVLAKKLDFGYSKSDLEFYLTILKFIHLATDSTSEVKKESRVYDLYGRIVARYRESLTKEICRQQIEYVLHLPRCTSEF
jgi:hypothetical protein